PGAGNDDDASDEVPCHSSLVISSGTPEASWMMITFPALSEKNGSHATKSTGRAGRLAIDDALARRPDRGEALDPDEVGAIRLRPLGQDRRHVSLRVVLLQTVRSSSLRPRI